MCRQLVSTLYFPRKGWMKDKKRDRRTERLSVQTACVYLVFSQKGVDERQEERQTDRETECADSLYLPCIFPGRGVWSQSSSCPHHVPVCSEQDDCVCTDSAHHHGISITHGKAVNNDKQCNTCILLMTAVQGTGLNCQGNRIKLSREQD